MEPALATRSGASGVHRHIDLAVADLIEIDDQIIRNSADQFLVDVYFKPGLVFARPLLDTNGTGLAQ